jgi:hypothetical protein
VLGYRLLRVIQNCLTILRLYNPHEPQGFGSSHLVLADSTKHCDSSEIESLADRSCDLDTNPSLAIDQKWDLWQDISKKLEEAIDRANNGNPTPRKFIRFHIHEHNSNIGRSDNDQELLDKLK